MQNAENPLTVLVDEHLESSLETVDSCEEKAKDVATGIGFPEEDAYQLGYAVREALVNAVVHGNQYSANKRVHFVLARAGDTLQITIEDEGRGFAPEAQGDPLAVENLLNQSGRGIMIIRAFVDELEIAASPHGGTRVVMKKSLAAG
jgi:serine/threonine-protein kinase RsbW